LRRCTVRTIDDPAEQAALEEKLRRGEQTAAATNARRSGRGKVSRLIESARQLSAAEQFDLAAELAVELPPDQQLDLIQRLVDRLEPRSLRVLAGQMSRARKRHP
jgi:hypothetical protein